MGVCMQGSRVLPPLPLPPPPLNRRRHVLHATLACGAVMNTLPTPHMRTQPAIALQAFSSWQPPWPMPRRISPRPRLTAPCTFGTRPSPSGFLNTCWCWMRSISASGRRSAGQIPCGGGYLPATVCCHALLNAGAAARCCQRLRVGRVRCAPVACACLILLLLDHDGTTNHPTTRLFCFCCPRKVWSTSTWQVACGRRCKQTHRCAG